MSLMVTATKHITVVHDDINASIYKVKDSN